MQQKSQNLVSELGDEGSLPLFLQIPAGVYEKVPEGKIDNTHFSEKGAITMAQLFVDEIKKQQLKLSKFMKK